MKTVMMRIVCMISLLCTLATGMLVNLDMPAQRYEESGHISSEASIKSSDDYNEVVLFMRDTSGNTCRNNVLRYVSGKENKYGFVALHIFAPTPHVVPPAFISFLSRFDSADAELLRIVYSVLDFIHGVDGKK